MKHVVLVGAGHAHAYSLKRAAAFVRRAFAVTLVSPDPFWYSGLATVMLGGMQDLLSAVRLDPHVRTLNA